MNKSDIVKVIKLRGPSKISSNKNDEFLSKIKPILGQNQINPSLFVTDYNKTTEFLSEGVELLVQVCKFKDKSFKIIPKKLSSILLAEQISKNSVLSVKLLQDIVKIKCLFDKKIVTTGSNDVVSVAKMVISNLNGYKFAPHIKK